MYTIYVYICKVFVKYLHNISTIFAQYLYNICKIFCNTFSQYWFNICTLLYQCKLLYQSIQLYNNKLLNLVAINCSITGLWCDTSPRRGLFHCLMPDYARRCRTSTLIMVPINFWQNSDPLKKKHFSWLKNWPS